MAISDFLKISAANGRVTYLVGIRVIIGRASLFSGDAVLTSTQL